LPITHKIKKIECNFALIQQYITDDNRRNRQNHPFKERIFKPPIRRPGRNEWHSNQNHSPNRVRNWQSIHGNVGKTRNRARHGAYTANQEAELMARVGVYNNDGLAGHLEKRGPTDYHFVYEDSYLANSSFPAISLTLPKTQQAINSGITVCKQGTIPATLKKATFDVAFLHFINSFALN
jgi:hypothetical protein